MKSCQIWEKHEKHEKHADWQPCNKWGAVQKVEEKVKN